jgi:hypothetical protein
MQRETREPSAASYHAADRLLVEVAGAHWPRTTAVEAYRQPDSGLLAGAALALMAVALVVMLAWFAVAGAVAAIARVLS